MFYPLTSPFLQQYKERDLIQPLPWPLNSSYPLIFHQYIYFFTSKENRNTFMSNPLKYLRQPKPIPSLPVKMAVVGPPKSGKTTGKAQDTLIHSKLFVLHFLKLPLFNVFVSLTLLFNSSGTDVCSKIWLGPTVHWQCYAYGTKHSEAHRSGCPDENVSLPGSRCA